MNTLDIGLTSLLLATFLGAGVVKGVTGMGLPTVAIGLLGAVMSLLTVAAILIIPSFVTNVWQMLVGPNKLRLIRRLWVMMLCIVISTVLGTRLLVAVDPVRSGRTLGIAMIAYAVVRLCWLSFPLSLACGWVRLRGGRSVQNVSPLLSPIPHHPGPRTCAASVFLSSGRLKRSRMSLNAIPAAPDGECTS